MLVFIFLRCLRAKGTKFFFRTPHNLLKWRLEDAKSDLFYEQRRWRFKAKNCWNLWSLDYWTSLSSCLIFLFLINKWKKATRIVINCNESTKLIYTFSHYEKVSCLRFRFVNVVYSLIASWHYLLITVISRLVMKKFVTQRNKSLTSNTLQARKGQSSEFYLISLIFHFPLPFLLKV